MILTYAGVPIFRLTDEAALADLDQQLPPILRRTFGNAEAADYLGMTKVHFNRRRKLYRWLPPDIKDSHGVPRWYFSTLYKAKATREGELMRVRNHKRVRDLSKAQRIVLRDLLNRGGHVLHLRAKTLESAKVLAMFADNGEQRTINVRGFEHMRALGYLYKIDDYKGMGDLYAIGHLAPTKKQFILNTPD